MLYLQFTPGFQIDIKCLLTLPQYSNMEGLSANLKGQQRMNIWAVSY